VKTLQKLLGTLNISVATNAFSWSINKYTPRCPKQNKYFNELVTGDHLEGWTEVFSSQHG
jgi:hypothetical protein